MAEARIITAGYRVDVEKLFSVTALNSARLAACARGLREVVEPYRVTGSDRLVLKVVAQSVDHLDEIIQRLSRFGSRVDHRPAYRRLLAAVGSSAKPFDVLLVDDLCRLSRDAAEMLRLARVLEYARITLISVADGIETGTKLSKLTLSVKAIFNEQYLDDLRERTLRGLQGRFARGLHTGGRIYGYGRSRWWIPRAGWTRPASR